MGFANIPYFGQFGSHLNKSMMLWRTSPGYTLQLILSSINYWGFLLVFILFLLGFLFALKKIFLSYSAQIALSSKQKGQRFLIFLFIAFVLVALARGRLSSKSTMHEGMAIVSQNAFMNHIALNPVFTMIKSLQRKEGNTAYLENIGRDLQVCKAYYDGNFFPPDGVLAEPIVAVNGSDSIKKLNVILVLMESMTMAKMGYYGNKNMSPFLLELSKESVFFDRFFSSGIHTFNGLFSSATGFPSIYAEQGLRQYTKQPFVTLASLLKPFGYRTYFCTTHDPVFDNMEGFFKLNGYDEFISDHDFDNSQSLGVTGVPDHVLYLKLVESINARKNAKPFLAMVMTGTDHGPWKIPSNITFEPKGLNVKENASLYADWSVRQLINESKKYDWYKNTVFVFLGDHGQIMNDVYDMPITYHHTPLIIHCPASLAPEVNHNLGTQQDLVKTISSLLGLSYPNFSFGVNILNEKRSFVSFSADDKLGYVTDDDFFYYQLLSTKEKRFVKYKLMDVTDYYQKNRRRADSLFELNMSLYNAAQYYIRENYFNF
ncbi:MAG: LTA synthase family protein [bacterium]|nr:LTA synthase family protein [bacterium]